MLGMVGGVGQHGHFLAVIVFGAFDGGAGAARGGLCYALQVTAGRVDRVEADPDIIGQDAQMDILADQGLGVVDGQGVIGQAGLWLPIPAGQGEILHHDQILDLRQGFHIQPVDQGAVAHGHIKIIGADRRIGFDAVDVVRQFLQGGGHLTGPPSQIVRDIVPAGEDLIRDCLALGLVIDCLAAVAVTTRAAHPGAHQAVGFLAIPEVIEENPICASFQGAFGKVFEMLDPFGVRPIDHIAAGVIIDLSALGVFGVPVLFHKAAIINAVGTLNIGKDRRPQAVIGFSAFAEIFPIFLFHFGRESPVIHQVNPVAVHLFHNHFGSRLFMDGQMGGFVHGVIHEFDAVHPDGAGAAPKVDRPVFSNFKVMVQCSVLLICSGIKNPARSETVAGDLSWISWVGGIHQAVSKGHAAESLLGPGQFPRDRQYRRR